jgi:K+-transporting ATPase KdpF subunit
MRTRSAVFERSARAMGEPIVGLVVAIGLGLYLLYTLIHPEKF